MSEPRAIEAAETDPAPSSGRPSAGSMLRQLRESAGVDITLLASAMKVSLQKIEALENEQFDQLPDLTFARGLAAAVCRAFGADPAPVLERMPVAASGLRAPSGQINQPFKRSGDRPAPMLTGSSFSKPLLIAVAGLLIAAGALWLLPTLPIQLGGPASTASAPSEDGQAQESVSPPLAAAPAAPEAPAVAVAPAPVGTRAGACARRSAELHRQRRDLGDRARRRRQAAHQPRAAKGRGGVAEWRAAAVGHHRAQGRGRGHGARRAF